MIKAKLKEDQRELNYKFHANPVPWFVNEPLYEKINRDKEEKR